MKNLPYLCLHTERNAERSVERTANQSNKMENSKTNKQTIFIKIVAAILAKGIFLYCAMLIWNTVFTVKFGLQAVSYTEICGLYFVRIALFNCYRNKELEDALS